MKRRMKSLQIDEISAVDRPAQKGALAAILKRDAPMAKGSAALTGETNGHTHLVSLLSWNGELNAGMTEHSDGHSHPWVRSADGRIVLGTVNGHTHDVSVVSKNQQEDDTMTEAEKLAKAQKDLEAANEKLAKAEADAKAAAEKAAADLAKAQAEAALSGDERDFYSKQDDAGKAAFLKMDEAGRKAEVAKTKDANAVVYKAKDGSEYRKSDDPRLVAMAKKMDADAEAVAKREAEIQEAGFAKRAADDLGHFSGDLSVRKEIVKAVSGIADEKVRDAAFESLKGADAALKGVFTSIGVEGSAGASDLDALAKKIAAEKSISYAKAYDEAIQTPEGKRLYEAK